MEQWHYNSSGSISHVCFYALNNDKKECCAMELNSLSSTAPLVWMSNVCMYDDFAKNKQELCKLWYQLLKGKFSNYSKI